MLFSVTAIAQKQAIELVTLKQISEPTAVSKDKYGNFYVADVTGTVSKYDLSGELLLNFSSQNLARISAIESSQSLRTFLFYEDRQEFLLLDRFLTQSSGYKLASHGIGFGRVAALSANNGVWIFDESDFSLKKIDPRLENVVVDAALDFVLDPSDHDISFMREYQNRLYLVDRLSGITVFDNLGNKATNIPVKDVDFLTFSNDQVAFLQEGQIRLIDLYNSKQDSIALPYAGDFSHFLIDRKMLLLFSKDAFEIYSLSR